ncbi:hypothetical protein AJ87_18690 [Rhizobium yanglingense]|nr:hypothetical protein AJ87_18690 [Rhizobium yanglingense]
MASKICSPEPSIVSESRISYRRRGQGFRVGGAGSTVPFRNVVTVEIEKVKGIKDRVGWQSAAAPAKRLLQRAEVRPPFLVEHDGLAVEDGRGDIEFARGGNDGRKSIGPVVAAAGDGTHASMIDMDCQPIAVELDLVEPLRSGRRLLFEERQTRLDPLWNRIEGKVRLGRVARLAHPTFKRSVVGEQRFRAGTIFHLFTHNNAWISAQRSCSCRRAGPNERSADSIR